MAARRLQIALGVLLVLATSNAFYLPGVAPREYMDGDAVDVKVNTLTSVKTQLPYEYYALPFCRPGHIENAAENLGEVLRGDKIQNSLYKMNMAQNHECVVLCKKTLKPEDLEDFRRKIDEDYRVNMIVDNLPVAMRLPGTHRSEDEQQKHVIEAGFPVGIVPRVPSPYNVHPQPGMVEGKHYLYNHLRFIVFYHTDPASYTGKRIVGFEVEPVSVQYDPNFGDDKPKECPFGPNDKHIPLDMEGDKEKKVVFTYDVVWKDSPVKWASRWDVYLHMTDNQIHWFSIINSLMIVLFLTGMVAMILMRTLNQDFRRYNQLETSEDAQEETGWKLVHGDVFRPPTHAGLLAAYVGTGVQVFGMTLITMIFAVLGFLSPANRGGLMTALLLLFVFMGAFAGYWSSRLYKMFKGTAWKRNTLMTAFMFPGIIFALFFFLNLLVWGERSAGAVPFWSMFALIFLWFGISVPLVFIGSYFGLKKPAIEHPVRTNQIPRQIPEQAWYMKPAFSILIGGILPFGAVFIELFFILSSLWLHQFYYMFTFLFIVFVILILTCAEITIVLCYFQLCSEDYHWWWRSYLTAGSSAVYLFAYSIFYYITKLDMDRPVSAMMFFGYMSMASFGFFVLTGSIGFFACFMFVRKIYGSVKVD
eukprot:tig00000829_g4654.t1